MGRFALTQSELGMVVSSSLRRGAGYLTGYFRQRVLRQDQPSDNSGLAETPEGESDSAAARALIGLMRIGPFLDRSRRCVEGLMAVPALLHRGAGRLAGYFRRPFLRQDQPSDNGGPAETPEGENDPSPAEVIAPSAAAPADLVNVGPFLDRSKRCAEGLRQACSDAESDFLNTGMQLQTIQAESDALTRSVVDVLSTDGEQTMHGALGMIQRHAADAIQELNFRRDKLSKDIEGMKGIYARMSDLGKQSGNFKRVAKNLKMVGLNISIESARTEEAKNTFQALAQEITQLSQTVWEVSGRVSDDTAVVQKNLDRIEKGIGGRMTHLDRLVGSAETAVASALSEVENLMQLIMHVLDGIGGKAKEISDQVGQMVVSIQIHDNISQRVEHIHVAIAEAVDLIESANKLDMPPAARQIIFGKSYGITRLQIAQIQTIEEDVSEVYSQSVTALDRLLSAVKGVAQPEGLDFSSGNAMCELDTAGNRHPVAVLRRALEQLIVLFDEGLDGLRQLSAAREETGQSISRIGTHIDKVRDINFDIHLKALNAVIKSTRLGDATGKAIEAIVNEMKELAEQSNVTIQQVTGIMEDIVAASDAMEQATRNDINDVDSAGQLLREGIETFSRTCVAFREQSLGAMEKGRKIEEEIVRVQHGSQFFNRMLSVFKKYHADLDLNRDLLQPFADAVSDDWMTEEKSIVSRYTMQRELDAHRGMYNTEAGEDEASPAGENSGAAREADDGFDDNVELF